MRKPGASQRPQRTAVLFKIHILDKETNRALAQLKHDLGPAANFDLVVVYDRRGVTDFEASSHKMKGVQSFGFLAEEMHALYPRQYHRSNVNDWRVRRLAHDNPEYAYLLWWQSHMSEYDFVWVQSKTICV